MNLEKATSFGRLTATVLTPSSPATHALVLLHGVGGNERALPQLGELIAPGRLIVSFRAPLPMSAQSFAWFQVQFLPSGPVHDWPQAQSSLLLLEEAIADLSTKSGIPLDRIAVFGFSQGAIMTIGLALQGRDRLEAYIACAGRTLPEFADHARQKPPSDLHERRIFVAHGTHDSKLPIRHGRQTEANLRELGVPFEYREYAAEHGVPPEVVTDAREWLP